jgi:thiamine biosynthesis lipoprotein
MDTMPAAVAIELAFDEVARLEATLTPLSTASELERLNRAAADERFMCSEDLYAALDTALALAAATDGAYDPTSEPLARAWQEAPGGGPDPGRLAAARGLVGWRMVLREPGRRSVRFRRPGMRVTLDAVARGYALERAAHVLQGRGIARAWLQCGDQVLAFTNHDQWAVVVPGPDDDSHPALRLSLSNAACATALQSLRGAGRLGSRRPPVLDPRTGRPPVLEASVTVVARSAARARALCEAFLVIGRDGARAHARAHPDLGVLWLERSGHGLRAWAWNLGRLVPEPGRRIEWMTDR